MKKMGRKPIVDTDLATQAAFTGWSGGWFTTMPGWLSIFFIAVIVFAGVALFHDLRRERREFGPGADDHHGSPGGIGRHRS